MKLIILGLVFLIAPYVLLANFAMPAIKSLKDVYQNADALTTQIVQSKPQN